MANKTELFIGNVDASHSCADIKSFMNTGTRLQVELKDIQEKAVRGTGKHSRSLFLMIKHKKLFQSGPEK